MSSISRHQHAERWRIELLKAGGASLDSLAAKFGVSRDAIDRHWHRHVSAELKAGYLGGPVQLQDLSAKAADTGGSVLAHSQRARFRDRHCEPTNPRQKDGTDREDDGRLQSPNWHLGPDP